MPSEGQVSVHLSISREILELVDKTARRYRLPRSTLITLAVARFLGGEEEEEARLRALAATGLRAIGAKPSEGETEHPRR